MWVPSLSCCFVHPKQRLQQQNYYSLCAPALICGVCMQKNDFKTKITSLYGSQTSPEVLCSQNSVLSTRMTSPYRFELSPVVFCVENSYFSTRITNLYGFLTSSVNLCIQNSVLITRITNLYWSLTSSVVYVCKIVTLRPELQVSMGLRPHLKFCESKSVCLAPESLDSMGPSHYMWFCAYKTASFGSRLQVSTVQDPICGLVHSKQQCA